MKPDPRRALGFALQFLVLFPICLWLYSLLLPAYQQVVVGLGNLLLRLATPLLEVDVLANGGWHVYRLDAGADPSFVYGMRPGALALIYVNLALLPALLGATPVPPRQRLRLVGLGLVLLVAFHAVAVAGLVRTWWCLQLAPDDFTCRSVRGALKVSGQLFGVAQWALLTWSVWLPSPPARTPRGRRR